jgi:hypothetical protein
MYGARLILPGMLAALAVNCTDATDPGGDPPVPHPVPPVVRVEPAAKVIVLGESQRFDASVTDSAGLVLAGESVEWFSTNPDVIAVTGPGVVTAVGIGEAAIVARVGENADSARVSVMSSDPEFVPRIVDLVFGDSLHVSAVNWPVGPDVTWITTDSAVAIVTDEWWLKAMGGGFARVWLALQSNGRTLDSIDVRVAPRLPLARIVPQGAEILVGQSLRLGVVGFSDPIWSSASPEVARIDSAGTVEGLSPGSSLITAKAAADTALRAGIRIDVKARSN